MSNRSKSIRAITVIELLVVIAIISILVAMLMPAISAVRTSYKTLRCEGNLRELGAAVHTYAAVYHGTIPQGGMNDGFNTTYWFDIFKSIPQYKTFAGVKVRCPNNSPSYPSGFSGPSYAMIFGSQGSFKGGRMPAGWAATYYHGFKLSAMQDSSRYWLFIDAATQGGPSTILTNPVTPPAGNCLGRNGFANRGGAVDYVWTAHPHDTANACFVDGHVENMDGGAMKAIGITQWWDHTGLGVTHP